MKISYSLFHIEDAARQFWDYAQAYKIIAFNGGLGAGKTTFTKALCQYLGVPDPVSSPTFSLINEYRFPKRNGEEQIIYHSDCYRLQSIEEAIDAGIEDMLHHKDAYCIIEWGERIAELLPAKTLWVNFSVLEGHNRELTLQTTP